MSQPSSLVLVLCAAGAQALQLHEAPLRLRCDGKAGMSQRVAQARHHSQTLLRLESLRQAMSREPLGVRRSERAVVDPFSRVVRMHQPCKHAASDPTLHESRSVEMLDESAARWARLTRARRANGGDEGGNVAYGEAMQFTRRR